MQLLLFFIAASECGGGWIGKVGIGNECQHDDEKQSELFQDFHVNNNFSRKQNKHYSPKINTFSNTYHSTDKDHL